MLCVIAALVCARPVLAQCDARGASWERTRAPGLPSDEQLTDEGAVIGRVEVRVEQIFNLDDPREDRWYARLANRWHACTRHWVVRDQLLFEPGDPYVPRLLAESERLLRAGPNFYDAIVRPVGYADGRVDVEVLVRDVWTLSPEIGYSRSGGENESSIGLSDTNVLGTGKAFEILHESDVDRDTNLVAYSDPNLFHTRARLSALYADNSDGDRAYLSVGRPFFSLDTRWSAGGTLSSYERVDQLYDLGEVVAEFRHDERFAEAQYGWSRGLVNGWTRRWSIGYAYERDEFALAPDAPPPALLPEDRELSYPWIAFEVIQDRYWSTQDVEDVDRTEDLFVGTRFRAQLGWSDTAFGADRDAALFEITASRGLGRDTDRVTLLTASATGRVEDGALRNGILDLSARYYHGIGERQRLFARLSVTATEKLDAESQLLLGGDEGLRGYPLRYQGGETRAIFTVEHRVYTDWYPWRLVRVGGAAFFDIGRTWGRAPFSTPSQGWLKDIGIGLRLSPTRSSRQVIHADVAFPLDGDDSIDDVQFVLETQRTF
jgi:outer membrane protein assembly factor BamA